jgi:hypothetical protein
MRSKDQILLEAAYENVNQNKLSALKHFERGMRTVWLAVPSHEDYTELYYGWDENNVKEHIYDEDDYDRFLVSFADPYALVGINDQGIEVAYTGGNLQDIVQQMQEDDYNGETFEYTEEGLIEWVKNTEADGDSSYGFFIFKNGEVMVGNANCIATKVD